MFEAGQYVLLEHWKSIGSSKEEQMRDFVVYHNPDSMGQVVSEGSGFSAVTDKNVGDIFGDRVWLLTGEGSPRKFYVRSYFTVDKLEPGSGQGFITRISGETGEVFDPMIEIGTEDWFVDFRKQQGNFAFGFQPINDFRFVAGLEKAVGYSSPFIVGELYQRKDVYEILDVPVEVQGGDWDTGYHPYGSDYFIFCTLGSAGRTGHDYPNRFDGDDLIWYGKTGSKLEHPSIQYMISGKGKVFVFFRSSDREPFQYAGLGTAKRTDGKRIPVEVVWEFNSPTEFHPEHVPGELRKGRKYAEGSTKRISVNAYERNPQARRDCIAHYGVTCQVCGFDFEAVYGPELGRGYIHVHHLVSLSKVTEEYEVDPINDLRPVCPNCHVMLHRRSETTTIEHLKDAMASAMG
jgi:5-methylcytosine-specific restriction enzyme A